MADKDIYLVPTDNIIEWGRRVYFYNCHRKGGDYAWHKDNLNNTGNIKPANIAIAWVFEEKWKP
jgi:pectinesterase